MAGSRPAGRGVFLAMSTTLAAAYVSEHYGAPLTILALLMGLGLNFLGSDPRLQPGLAFVSGAFLRSGVVLIGLHLTLAQLASLGPVTLGAIVAILAATVACGVAASRLLRLNAAFAVLASGAVAICGASAALALAAALGDKRITRAELTLVLAGIAMASAVATILYPALAHQLGLSDAQAGFVLGASIHDVAQAISAGFAFSAEAGETATIVKLARVALLAPVLFLVSSLFPGASDRRIRIPGFLLAFALAMTANSLGLVPARVAALSPSAATGLLACAVTASAMLSPMREVMDAGPRPFALIAVTSAVSLALSVAAARLLFG